METVTLKHIHQDLKELKKEMRHIRTIIDEEYSLSDEVIKEVEESIKRPKSEFISHKEMAKEFGQR